jgi:putative flippase GtrA
MTRVRSTGREAWRFAAVGIGSTVLHIAVASALIEVARYTAGEANGIAFIIATLASYWLNTAWTFQAPLALGSLSRFVLVAAFGLILTIGIASVIEKFGYHYLIGICLVVTIVPALTFCLHTLWTYKARLSVK